MSTDPSIAMHVHLSADNAPPTRAVRDNAAETYARICLGRDVVTVYSRDPEVWDELARLCKANADDLHAARKAAARDAFNAAMAERAEATAAPSGCDIDGWHSEVPT